jgi:hypothetical protein
MCRHTTNLAHFRTAGGTHWAEADPGERRTRRLRWARDPFTSLTYPAAMPLDIPQGDATVFIRREAFERVGLTRGALDARLNLTPEEFRVEGGLIVVGPLVGESTLGDLIEEFEQAGLTYFDDFFELGGNWPDWLQLVARAG